MSLEFEKLTTAVADMARETNARREKQQHDLQQALSLLQEYATSWEITDQRLRNAIQRADEKFYRSARPLHHDDPLDQGLAPAVLPDRATIIATDGSQIVPDRHAPFLYYLINVGTITYYHGSGRPPDVESFPRLDFPRADDADMDDAFAISTNLVNMLRDRAEIATLAAKVAEAKEEPGPTLGVLDQRLLYWPIGNIPGGQDRVVVEAWQEAMSAVRAAGGWLAGFIDRPGKRSVLTMLKTVDLESSGGKISDLYRAAPYAELTDTDLFDAVLAPGQRSAVFVDISQHNNTFAGKEPENEVCFFYLKTGEAPGQLARVDIPMWVARDPQAVAATHALLFDQCRIIGNYPYVITRADEIAVVGRRDQAELENRIALRLAEEDIHVLGTAKQQSKDFARGGKTRMEGL
jgi:hypothetical protein